MQQFGQGLRNNKEHSDILRISQYVKEVMDMSLMQDYPFFHDQLQRVLERISDQSLRLAVVGEFSSGKSTFINALIGRDILKHGASETTATITEVENNPNKEDPDRFDVYFSDGSVEENLEIGCISDYTTTQSASHQVAKEVQRVVIRSHIIDTESPLVFVDTPGLNGIADNHREQTLHQIERAHACVYLIPLRGLGESDIEFIRHITEFQQDIIFVQNFIDELVAEEGETVAVKLQEQRAIIEKRIISEGKKLRYRIVGISARQALMARDRDVLMEEDTREGQTELLQKSGWEAIPREIQSVVKENGKSKGQIISSLEVFIRLLLQLETVITSRWDDERQLWEHSSEGEIAKKVEILKEKLLQEKDKRREAILNFARYEGGKLRKILRNKIEQETEQANEKCLASIKQIDDLDSFEDAADTMVRSLYLEVNGIQNKINTLLDQGYQNILQDALLRILEYNAVQSKQIEPDFHTQSFQADFSQFAKEEDSISKERMRLAAEEEKQRQLERKVRQVQSEISDVQSDMQQNQEDREILEQRKQAMLRSIGHMPKVEIRQTTESYTESRGIILDFIIGEKTVTRQVEVPDDTKQRRWKNEKAEIENAYYAQVNQYKIAENYLSSKMEELQEDLMYTKKEQEVLRKRAEETKMLLEQKIRELEEKKHYARREYLELQKKQLSQKVSEYFDEAGEKMTDSMREAMDGNMQLVEKEVERIFEYGFYANLQALEEATHPSKATESSWKENLKQLNQIRTILERYVQAQ